MSSEKFFVNYKTVVAANSSESSFSDGSKPLCLDTSIVGDWSVTSSVMYLDSCPLIHPDGNYVSSSPNLVYLSRSSLVHVSGDCSFSLSPDAESNAYFMLEVVVTDWGEHGDRLYQRFVALTPGSSVRFNLEDIDVTVPAGQNIFFSIGPALGYHSDQPSVLTNCWFNISYDD